MFVVGEVRDFATGVMECVPSSYNGAVGIARMQTEQRIWDGERWTRIHEASPPVSEYFQAQIHSRYLGASKPVHID